MAITAPIEKSAELSPCGTYRYKLTRRWGSGPLLPFIMLNPSVADADIDDPTIRRCIAFAHREKYSGIMVVNLFAYRATEPDELLEADDPHGPDNWHHLGKMFAYAVRNDVPVVCAWGSNRIIRQSLVQRVMELGEEAGTVCLGTTLREGNPRHPLFVDKRQPLVTYIPWRAKRQALVYTNEYRRSQRERSHELD
jgi:hypothetical protein